MTPNSDRFLQLLDSTPSNVGYVCDQCDTPAAMTYRSDNQLAYKCRHHGERLARRRNLLILPAVR